MTVQYRFRRRRDVRMLPFFHQPQLLLLLVVILRMQCSWAFVPLVVVVPSTNIPPTSKNSGGDRFVCCYSSAATALHCQLLGMNCATATDFSIHWPDFCQRGGQTDVHADGWGLAYYQGNGLREFHDIEAASTSALAAFLTSQKIRTHNMLAHIRYATSGQVELANVHPFAREMWALNWCFCHNGQIPLFDDHPETWLGSNPGDRIYYPVGDTDSEAAFCAILNALRAQFTDTMPSLPILHKALTDLCQEMVNYNPDETILNFLLTCGPHVLWVYSWPGQRPGSSVWNGLHYTVQSTQPNETTQLRDDDYKVEIQQQQDTAISEETNGATNVNGEEKQRQVCVVATKPLSNDEEWIELKRGELIVMDNGMPHVSPRELFRVELQGHGLDNDGKVLKPVRLEEDLRRFELNQEFYVGGGI